VLAHLDKLVISRTYPNQRFEPVFGRNLEGEKRKRSCTGCVHAPTRTSLKSTWHSRRTPVWRPHGALGFAATPVAMRMYAVAGPSGTRVMPGGLARVAADTAVDVVSTQRGGGSKDNLGAPGLGARGGGGKHGQNSQRTGEARRHPVAAG